MKLLKPLVIVVLCVAVVLAAHQLLQRSEPEGQRRGGGEATVVAQPVGTRSFADRVEAVGTVIANESVTITPPVTERVASVHFEDGASVARGDTIVELEHDEESAELEERRVALNEQERQFERVRTLRESELVSQEEFDLARDALHMARSRVEAAEARLRDRVLTAPFDGVLGTRRVSPGALVSPGQIITTLDDLSTVRVDFTVPEALLSQLAVGLPISARAAAWPEDRFDGRTTSIDSRVDPATRAMTVQARIPNTDLRLRPGMLLAIELSCCPRDGLGVPERALLSYADRQYVFVVRSDDTVEQRQVRLGVRDPGWVEVVEGLEPDEMIVVDGLLGLRDGASVRVEDGAAVRVDGGEGPGANEQAPASPEREAS